MGVTLERCTLTAGTEPAKCWSCGTTAGMPLKGGYVVDHRHREFGATNYFGRQGRA